MSGFCGKSDSFNHYIWYKNCKTNLNNSYLARITIMAPTKSLVKSLIPRIILMKSKSGIPCIKCCPDSDKDIITYYNSPIMRGCKESIEITGELLNYLIVTTPILITKHDEYFDRYEKPITIPKPIPKPIDLPHPFLIPNANSISSNEADKIIAPKPISAVPVAAPVPMAAPVVPVAAHVSAVPVAAHAPAVERVVAVIPKPDKSESNLEEGKDNPRPRTPTPISNAILSFESKFKSKSLDANAPVFVPTVKIPIRKSKALPITFAK